MQPAHDDTLRDAIARNAGAVISLPAGGVLRHCKTRLLAAEDDGFWVEAPAAAERPLVDDLMAKATTIGASLKSGHTKVCFTTLIRQFRGQLQVNANTAVDAVMLAWPAQLKAIQRRTDYRVGVPGDAEISVRCWRLGERAFLKDRPPASAELDVSLRDLSVGGTGLTCRLDDGAPKLADDQRLRIVVDHDGRELLLEGRLRHVKPLADANVRLGVQFKKLADDIDGRQTLATLTQIVGRLQRDEVRCRKLSAPRQAG
jgi:c-di-GMP-binding flagellar brake protein YcgR